MNHHGQCRLNSDSNITSQITTGCISQRRGSILINKITIFPVVTLAKYVFLYLSIHNSNSNLGKGEVRRYSKQGRDLTVAIVAIFPIATPTKYTNILS